MCKVRKKHLLAINGMMWAAIGTKISITGICHYLTTPPERLWWMIPLSLLVFAGFYMMFTGFVRKYSERIHSLPGPEEPIYKTFSLKGYIIIAFPGHHAQIYPWNSPYFLCLVLSGSWPGPLIGRYPLLDPLVELRMKLPNNSQ